jgi:hypothetical protein
MNPVVNRMLFEAARGIRAQDRRASGLLNRIQRRLFDTFSLRKILCCSAMKEQQMIEEVRRIKILEDF